MPTSLQIGHGSRLISTAKIFTNGELTQTGERMDIAIQGDGFFEVQLADGTQAFTRDGALKVASDGRVTTSDGLPLQGGWQPIPAGTEQINIAPNGTVSLARAS